MSSRSRVIVQKALEICSSTHNQGDKSKNEKNVEVNLQNCEIFSNVSEFGEKSLESEMQCHILELNEEFSSFHSKVDGKITHDLDISNIKNSTQSILELEYQNDAAKVEAGPSNSLSKQPPDKNCHFTRKIYNDSDTSDDEPFKPDDESDEYLPNSENSSDTDEHQTPRQLKNTSNLNTNTNVSVLSGNNKTCENSEVTRVNENQVKKRKVFKIEEKKVRKRSKQPNMWKKNIAAIARQRGETYLNQKGKEIQGKVVNLGELCTEGCKKKCSDKLDSEQRINIFSRYYKLDEDTKNMLLFKSITCKVPARPQKNAARHKSASFTYTVTVNNTHVIVCKKAFCSLYQIGKKKVEYLQQSIKDGLHTPKPNRRGKHDNRPHKLADDVKQYIMEHINSFPSTESHYSRNKNHHKKYLSPILNISKMYKLYNEKCSAENKPPRFNIKYCTYSKIFSTEFNFSFGEPRSDTCSTCDSGKSDAEHKENYEAAFSLQRMDREYAKCNNGVCYLTMDLQQTLPLPKLTTSKAFYLRQMWMYNLGIHSITKHAEKANFFTWTEDVAHRGSSEVCSALLTMTEFNEIFQDNNISHLIMWTDSCAGQNKNFLIICLYQYLILKGTVKTIDHKFPEVGHSYLDSDRDFGRIEKVLRRYENIFLPEDYRTIISQSSKMNHVTDMLLHFRQFDDLATKLNLLNRKKNILGENVPFRDGIKWIRVCKYGSYLYKENFDPYTPFKEVNIIRNSRIPPPNKVEIERIGKKTGKLSVEKIENLKSQLQYVREPFRWFYNDVIAEQEGKT